MSGAPPAGFYGPMRRVSTPRVNPSIEAADPRAPADYSIEEHRAIHAMAQGVATPDQQVMVLEWIVHRAARAYDLSYRDRNPEGTAFAEGRRFTGLQIIRLLTVPFREAGALGDPASSVSGDDA